MRIFIFGVGFALSVLNSKAMREPQFVELAKGKFRAFLYAYRNHPFMKMSLNESIAITHVMIKI